MSIIFKKSEYIVYDNAGVCQIEDISTMKFDYWETERTCYILKPIYNNKSVFYVPVDNEKLTQKMRYVMTKDEINTILDNSRKKQLPWNDDRRKRTEEFKHILSEKNQQDLILLVSCIYLKKGELAQSGKKLSSSDEVILHETERFIKEEFAYALGLSISEVENYITTRLEIKK